MDTQFVKAELTAQQKLAYLERYTKQLEVKLGASEAYIQELEERVSTAERKLNKIYKNNLPEELKEEWLAYKISEDRLSRLKEVETMRKLLKTAETIRDNLINSYYEKCKKLGIDSKL